MFAGLVVEILVVEVASCAAGTVTVATRAPLTVLNHRQFGIALAVTWGPANRLVGTFV